MAEAAVETQTDGPKDVASTPQIEKSGGDAITTFDELEAIDSARSEQTKVEAQEEVDKEKAKEEIKEPEKEEPKEESEDKKEEKEDAVRDKKQTETEQKAETLKKVKSLEAKLGDDKFEVPLDAQVTVKVDGKRKKPSRSTNFETDILVKQR